MSTHDRKAKAQAAARSQGKGANAIVIGGIVVVLAIVLVVGGVIWNATSGGGGGTAGELPEGVAKGEPIEPYADAEPAEDAPVVDVYEDFRCPACRTFEQTTGRTVTQLAEDGRIRLRVHLKTVIDSMTGGDSSAVSASSAVCAADQGVWTEYHSALFARQPSGETREGFSEEDLTRAAEEAGLGGEDLDEWQQCTDRETYVDYVTSVDEATTKEGINSTPTVVVEGTRFNWGAVVSEQGQVDTDRLEEVLTSGEVPEDMVATQ